MKMTRKSKRIRIKMTMMIDLSLTVKTVESTVQISLISIHQSAEIGTRSSIRT